MNKENPQDPDDRFHLSLVVAGHVDAGKLLAILLLLHDPSFSQT